MPRLSWTLGALRDVERLQAFIAEVNPGAGRRAAAAIRRGVTLLARHPGMGRVSENPERGVRRLVVGFGSSAYVVLYRVDADAVAILEVRHGRETEQ